MKLGFIGTGAMANAIIGGIIKDGLVEADQIIGSTPTEAGRKRTANLNPINVTASNVEVVEKADTIFLSVKPNMYDEVLEEIRDHVREDQIIISIGAGKTLDYLEDRFQGIPVKLIRVMPNTPSQVGEGMSAACPNEYVSDEEVEWVEKLLSAFGKVRFIPEDLFEVVTGVSGSGPAYVFMFIEAMADAAVLDGMKRGDAYEFAAQTVLGSAKMVMETGRHPGELKDMVCSPSGTTIAAVRSLEEHNFRGTVIDGVHACTEKAREMKGDN